jgi:DNA topoisomerase-3
MALQKDAEERYGYTAAKTSGIAMSLYEKTLITYPETTSRHIPDNVFASIPGLLAKTGFIIPGYNNCVSKMNPGSLNLQSVGEVETACPHAILPTGAIPDFLTKEEKRIYRMIAGRLIEAFSLASEKESVKTEINCGGYIFRSCTLRILNRGWRSVLSLAGDREKHETDDSTFIPSFVEGEAADISGYNLLGKKTLPPSLYTEGTLLEELQQTGAAILADRTSVIEKLIKEGYIERSQGILYPTEKGLVVYHAVKDMRIADINLASSWERALAAIEKGNMHSETFMQALKIYTGQVTREILREE